MLICRLEDAIKYQVENGRFDIECVAQYYQNTRERLQLLYDQLDESGNWSVKGVSLATLLNERDSVREI